MPGERCPGTIWVWRPEHEKREARQAVQEADRPSLAHEPRAGGKVREEGVLAMRGGLDLGESCWRPRRRMGQERVRVRPSWEKSWVGW